MSAYQHIAQRAAQVSVRPLCQVLRVAPAAYYAWRRDGQQPVTEPAWQIAVREAFAHHAQRYGTRRLRAEVQADGHSDRPLAHSPRVEGARPAGVVAPLVRAAYH